MIFRISFFDVFSLYTPMERSIARRDSAHVTLKVNCACIPCFKSIVPRACLVKVPFLAFFEGLTCKQKWMWSCYPNYIDYIDSKYIWVHGVTA